MVIINADDFGMNESCSKAVISAFEKRLVTDTTIMANGAYFDEAISLAKKNRIFDRIGIHLNLTEGEPLTEDIKSQPRFAADGRFNRNYRWSDELSDGEKSAVYKELTAQVKRVQQAGIRITHADSHHYIHNAEFLAPIVERVCGEHAIAKLRLMRNCGSVSDEEKRQAEIYNWGLRSRGFRTTEYFGRLSESEMIDTSENTEFLVHPDFDRDGNLVDRHGVKNGFAFGDLITKLSAKYGSYNEL